MLIREMKSDMCICNTPVHTGAFLIGLLTFVLEVISILFEISSHTDSDHTPINTTELANDHVKSFEYAGYYADQIVVGSGLVRHLFYYVLHLIGLVASALLIYGNRTSRPKLYFPFLAVSAAEIIVAGVESVLFLVAIIGIRAGGYPDIPIDPDTIRSDIVLILLAAIILEVVAIVLSAYFMWVVWRGKLYLEEFQKHSFDNSGFTVTYTNQPDVAASGTVTPVPSVPATYRI